MPDSTSAVVFRAADPIRQCAASFIDMLFVIVCAGIAALLSHDVVVTSMIVLEAVAVLAVAEGSRGVTPGNLMLGLRTIREEGAHDPSKGILPAGMGRILVKYCLLVASMLAMVVGFVLVACSPLFSHDDLNRGWANRLPSRIFRTDSNATNRSGFPFPARKFRRRNRRPFRHRFQRRCPRALRPS